MKRAFVILTLSMALITQQTNAQKIYHTNGGEIIFSGANVNFNGVDVNTNIRFTLFFHVQHFFNLDLTDNLGLFTGFGIRNVGLIMEDHFQNLGYVDVGTDHPDYNKSTKIKHRSYSLGFPLAAKIGSFSKNFFVYAGGEYEWMFHYKQKKFIDGEKYKMKGWTNERVTPWIPSLFAGVQFPGGFNLKFKYYMDNFLNSDFTGKDFGEQVDYSQFESSGIWYVSLAIIINKQQLKKVISGQTYDETASR